MYRCPPVGPEVHSMDFHEASVSFSTNDDARILDFVEEDKGNYDGMQENDHT